MHVHTPVREDDAALIRPLIHVGEHVANDGGTRGRAALAELDSAGLVVGVEPILRAMRGERPRGLSLPILTLPADLLQVRKPDPLGDGAKRRTGADGLELFGIANGHDLRAPLLGLDDEAGKLARADHAGLIDHEHVALAQRARTVRPGALPARQRARGDAGGFLQPLRCLAREGGAMNAIALRFPCFARSRQQAALAGAGDADDSGDPSRAGEMFDGGALLVGKPRGGIAHAEPNGRVLTFDGAHDMLPVHTMIARLLQPVGGGAHGALDVDHIAR